MFKNVLVGVDDRQGGRDAIALATRLVDEAGKLTLLNVHSGVLRPVDAASPGAVSAEQERSHALLEAERERAGVQAELISVVSSSPGKGLHQQAEQQQADLIVVGSCSRGTLGRAMLGDDTRAALNGSPCAVAVAAHSYAEAPTPIAKVGVGYDGSPESEAALAMAHELAGSARASVIALEAVSMPSYAYSGMVSPAIGDTMEVMIEDAKERMRALPGVDGRAVYGFAGEELAALGDELDILVVGSRGYGPVKRLVVGSTSEYLERHARCSLLVLPRVAGD
jgi:nucleotide-binding universal stress UspA family protein